MMRRRGEESSDLQSSTFRLGDVFAAGVGSISKRGARSALSAIGVSIGIAALVGVLGLSESSSAQLNDELTRLGTNLLVVTAGTGFGTETATLDADASGRISHIGAVSGASSVISLEAKPLRNRWMGSGDTRGLGAVGADAKFLETVSGSMAKGSWPGTAWANAPVGVVGATAAQRLGITDVSAGPVIRVGNRDITIVGILDPLTLAADLDRAVFVDTTTAELIAGAELTPTSIYVRTSEATVSPLAPENVEVIRPSDALAAKASAENTFTALFVGLGAVALLVGGIGIANVMIISVIERRSEIGLRRALGARQAHIRRQFLAEAVALGLAGGIAGLLLGSIATVAFAKSQGWRVVIPISALEVGLGGAVLIGGIAGLYPAIRAARLSPTDALRGG